jgi:hypothetical protein
MRSGKFGGARLGLALLCALVILTGCELPSPIGSAATPTPHPQETAWTQLLRQVKPDGSVGLRTALQAFAIAIGPLPGVSIPPGPVGRIPSGTFAVAELINHWKELTPAQQQTANGYLDAPFVQPTASGSGSRGGASAEAPARPVGGCDHLSGAGVNYRQWLDPIVPEIVARLGSDAPTPLIMCLSNTDLNRPQNADMWTKVVDKSGLLVGPASSCHIYIYEPTVRTFPPSRVKFLLAHEAFHCFQSEFFSSADGLSNLPPWIREGQAAWVADDLRGPDSYSDGWWDLYLRLYDPDTGQPVALFQRTYDALGFYTQLQRSGVNPWGVMGGMLQSYDRAASNVLAYHVAASPAGGRFLDTWASSYWRQSKRGGASWGSDWEMPPAVFKGITDTVPTAKRFTLTPMVALDITPQPYTEDLFLLTPRVDVLEVAFTGHARLHDAGSRDVYPLKGNAFCVNPHGCTSCAAAARLPKLTGQVVLAWADGPDGEAGEVAGKSLNGPKGYCSNPSTPSAGSSGGSSGGPPTTCPVTAAQVGSIVGEPVTGPTITPGTNPRTDLQGILCRYSGPTTFVALTIARGPQAAATYNLFLQDDQGSGLKAIVPVPLGDRAYATTAVGTTQYVGPLLVLKGNTLLGCGVGLTSDPLTAFEPKEVQIATLALQRL